jgi:hypothetical protein
MTTYPSLQTARADAPAKGAITIIEIDHVTDGRCYIGSRVPMTTLATHLGHPSLADIARLITEHNVRTEQIERHDETCERCGCQVDGATSYRQQEWTRLVGSRVQVTAYYCMRCAGLLGSIGQGEYTGLAEHATDIPSVELTTKID